MTIPAPIVIGQNVLNTRRDRVEYAARIWNPSYSAEKRFWLLDLGIPDDEIRDGFTLAGARQESRQAHYEYYGNPMYGSVKPLDVDKDIVKRASEDPSKRFFNRDQPVNPMWIEAAAVLASLGPEEVVG